MFTKKNNVEVKVNDSVSLQKEVENTMAVFTNTISKLKTTSDNALKAKEEKEKEITALQLEATALAGVAARANNFVEKIQNLFN